MGAVERILVAGAVLVVLATSSVGSAAADERGDSDEARDLVLQGIALIVNTPDDMHEIEERIEHALEAPHTEDVNLDFVQQAAEALEDGDLQRTRELLQSSIGAGPFVGSGVPEPVREASGEPGQPAFAVGAQAGTTVVLDEYRADTGIDGGDAVLLVLSVAAVALGALMAWRLRPPDTVRQLRRSAPRREA